MVNPDPHDPSKAVIADSEAEKAPDPRRHYNSPEELLEDIHLDLETRASLLTEWKQDLGQRLEAEAEGMSAQDPMSAGQESRLAAEALRVNKALAKVSADLGLEEKNL
jgi:hypothetical protein